MLLFAPPYLHGKYVSSVLSSRWLTAGGPMEHHLREKAAEFLGADYSRVLVAGSATAAAQAIFDLLASQGERAIDITEATWPGVLQTIQHAGLVRGPGARVETDIGGRSWLDPGKGSVVVWDASHSWVYQKNVARFWFASLYPTKLVPAAEGSIIVCRDEADVESLRLWLYCGLTPGAAGQGHLPKVCGRKAGLTAVQAALAVEALELAPAHIEATRNAWFRLVYWAHSLGVPYRNQPMRPYLFQVELPKTTEFGVPVFRERLQKAGIPTAWNFRPAPLVTVPCHAGADPRTVMEACAEVLGL
jgi:dTDP-4-amino-4,6-dideoxygalactose transaminase